MFNNKFMNKQVFSERWILIKQDLKKVGIGFLLAIGGATCAYLGDLSGIIDYSAYGEYSQFVALAVGSVCSSLINLIRKWMGSTVYTK